MTEPTDADRKHAAELIYHNRPGDQVEAVARALAGERAKFLALADELDVESHNAALLTSMAAVVAERVNRETAERIRRAVEDNP